MAYVYIVQSEVNSRYYIGSTNDLKRRLAEHNNGKTKSLKFIRPVKLVLHQEYSSLIEARKIELKLKKFKNKNILERMIREGIILLGP